MNVSEKLGQLLLGTIGDTCHTSFSWYIVWEICLLVMTNAGIEHIWKFSTGSGAYY